ncbi:MAG: transketolase C-terminal domain-containing protein [Christensenella sp.]|nr:transketolase C-terminal domain-containing protein [Christensenella sp.]
MSIAICKDFVLEKQEMRNAYCEALIDMAREDDNIVALDADLMAAMGTKPFQKEFPDRMIDCGIQEANMVGVAAGLSARGKIPFAHTFAPFLTRRACDQIFMSAAYAKLNVKLVGSDPGITAALNGGTHMPFEDMGIMRLIPTMTVIEPTDTTMLKDLMPKIAKNYGVYYMRLVRKNVIGVYQPGSTFEIGKAVTIKDGKDATIIASGFCVNEAINAAKILSEQGIDARVINMFTWKPIDEEAILRAAAETGAIVTAENHHVINGLGSAVSDVIVKNNLVPMEMIGIQDSFGEVGPVDYLKEHFKLTDRYIVEAVKKACSRK